MQEIQETQVQSLDWEDPLEEEMATHSTVLAWRSPWTEEAASLGFIGSQRDRAKQLTISMNFLMPHICDLSESPPCTVSYRDFHL